MSRGTEKEKSIFLLEKEVTLISAVNNPRLGPYLDIFRHHPENIMLEPLGILSGFFKINSPNEESSYIVNFLSSVLKKEYYINSKRAIENSFDSALRKVNLALSEIAKEGNIDWLGKIDGTVCVLEKNNLHFSVCGNAKILLIRNESLSEISKDVAIDEAAPNPLKTFVNVSSGRLEENDKIIICAPDIFEVFSEAEIKKGSLRLSPEKFTQFLKTGLINKLDIVGTIVIDIFKKKEKVKQETSEGQPEISNVFSQKAFEKKRPTIKGLPQILKQAENGDEYTDEKTGHIYIHEGKEGGRKESAATLFWFGVKEKLADIFYSAKNKSKRRLMLLGRSLINAKNDTASKIRTNLEKRKRNKLEIKAVTEKEKILKQESISLISDYTENLKEQTKPKKDSDFMKSAGGKSLSFLQRIKLREQNISSAQSASPMLQPVSLSPEEDEASPLRQTKRYSEKTRNFLRNLIPDSRKIKDAFISLTPRNKLIAAAVIFLVFAVPLLFIRIKDARNAKIISDQPQEKTPSVREIFSQEKNIVFIDTLEKVFEARDIKKLVILNEKLFIFGKNTISAQEPGQSAKEISFPQNFGTITEVSPMNDLNLILIATDQRKIISFAPVSSKFTENNIQIPENANIAGMGTYLTYLYLLDSQNSQIYRYPRVTGGFGEKADWLKDSLNLSNSRSMAIDENIYLPSGDKILKLFKGKQQDFNLETTVNPFIPEEIFTDSETANLYILDSQNGRVIKYSKDGTILNQYFNEGIKNATSLTVDEKNNKVYLLNSDGVSSFSME